MIPTETTGRTTATAHRRRRLQIGLAVGLAAITLTPLAASAQTTSSSTPPVTDGADYVTTTVPAPVIDVTGFSPECIRDAPFIRYTIVPRGFTPTPTQATLVIRDRNGNAVRTQTVNSLSGSIIWPGAAVDGSGNGTDWPGWKRADDGVSFTPDPSDAILREGLSIEVTINPTATATVSYPAATTPCANPPGGSTPTTTVAGQSPPTTVCVPGRNSDGTPANNCAELPRTGGNGAGNTLIIGIAALFAGLLFLTASRRGGERGSSPSPS
jgi:LPXTG-motif cell wall-anchored protein